MTPAEWISFVRLNSAWPGRSSLIKTKSNFHSTLHLLRKRPQLHHMMFSTTCSPWSEFSLNFVLAIHGLLTHSVTMNDRLNMYHASTRVRSAAEILEHVVVFELVKCRFNSDQTHERCIFSYRGRNLTSKAREMHKEYRSFACKAYGYKISNMAERLDNDW